MPTTDNSVARRTLIKSKSDFYVEYTANYADIEKAIAGIVASADKLNDFKEKIKLEPENFEALYKEIKDYLDEELNLMLTKYELQVVRVLTEFIRVLKVLINTKEVAILFKIREIEEQRTLVKLVEGNLNEFKEASDRAFFLISSFRVKKIKTLPESYNKLVENLRPLVIRLNEIIAELTKQIDILDAKTQRLLDKMI